MKQRTRDLLLLYGLALLVNGFVAILINNPGYTDAYYYFNGGRFIAEGHGMVEPYLWNYVSAPPSLPAPAFAYWQPLASYLSALGMVLFSRKAAFGSAQAIYVLVGSTLPLITYAVASQLSERRQAILAGLLTVFSGFYVVRWSLPETFTPFALSGAGALALISLGRRTGRWWAWVLAGICAGLAHLTRADGLLLIGVLGLIALLPRLRKDGGPVGAGDTSVEALAPAWRRRGLYVVLGLVGYLVIMAPWFVRNLVTFGSVQPPGGFSTLWLVEYNGLFNYPSNLTPDRYFSAGWGTILRVKGQALLWNLGTFVGVHNLVFLTPFTLIGLRQRWRDDWLLPAMTYGVALYAAMTFAFSLPGMRGGLFHSGGVLLPFIFTVAVIGLEDALRWAARKRGWRFDEASKVFSMASIVLAVCVTGFVLVTQVIGPSDLTTVAWNHQDAVYNEIGETLDALGVPANALVMSNSTPSFYTHTGRGGIPLPNGDEANLLRAADDYGVTYLVIDHNVVTGLASLYEDGPSSERLILIETYDSETTPVYLYRIRLDSD